VRLPLSRGIILLFVGLGAVLVIAIGLTIFGIISVTRSDNDGYEPIE
jgi:CHASE3 domain sensor protein